MNGKEFEKEVLRVARNLWKRDITGGAEFVDGRERDAIFYEDDVIHLVEATIERSEEKAKNDTKKLARLAGDMRKKHPDYVVKCWFITRDEPTDRQRAAARAANYTIHAVGFKEFQGRLIDAKEYIRARENHRFGSAHIPSESGSQLKYVPIDIKERSSTNLCSLADISQSLCLGKRISLTADFGAGKSMVLREIFHTLSRKYLEGKIPQFPVHINLREHSGTQYPDEILERHARIIGFKDPTKLVRAWRAGYVILLLDGFDEITSLGFQGKWAKLKEVRYRALVAVRELIDSQPAEAGVIVAGREFYFDSYGELRSALALGMALELTLNEFSDEQVAALLSVLDISANKVAPAWLPKRPLFVATLALRGYLADVRGSHSASVGDGWNDLVASICRRESKISIALDAETIRRVLERVATVARSRSGQSALSQLDLVNAFSDVCGYAPDEQGLLLLERLPGLGIATVGAESRAFVDSDFECALGAGDVCRYFVEPWSSDGAVEETARPLTSVGIAVGASILVGDTRANNADPALQRARGNSCLTFDLLELARSIGSSVSSAVSVSDLHIGHFEVGGKWPVGVSIYLNDCILDILDVDPASEFAENTRIQGCLIRSISGVHAIGDLPKDFLDGRSDVEDFADGAATNASILETDLALPVRVMLVILRKLYMQMGAARRENAFYRGLDTNAQRYVEDILDVLGSEGLASREKRGGEPLVIPDRAQMRRIIDVISAPSTSMDPLLVRVRKMA